MSEGNASVDFLRTAEDSDINASDYDDNDIHDNVDSKLTNVKIKQEHEKSHTNEKELEEEDKAVENVMYDEDSNIMKNHKEPAAEQEEEEAEEEEEEKDDINETLTNSRIHRTGTEESMRRDEQSHAYDRKLTRLIQQYPSIWCTMHPDYGNYDVTRQQWRIIASHFRRNEDVKVRWKNIRKRYVRVEQRMREGKRFNGYFDKATTFLSNRNLPPELWENVDCGTDDGDTYDRTMLDDIAKQQQQQLQQQNAEEEENIPKSISSQNKINIEQQQQQEPSLKSRPIDVLPIDLKIINFTKRYQILWRRVRNDDAHDTNSIRQLWLQLCKTLPGISYDDIVYRWHYLYEMYKAFRLKKIKDKELLANMELKYSKYLAKLYFLYKIDEDVLRNECTMINDDLYELESLSEHLECNEQQNNLQDAFDDKKFVISLIRIVRQYPALWDMRHIDYEDILLRGQLWLEVTHKLANHKRDAKTIRLRWLLIKYNYYRYLRDRDRHTPMTLKFLQKIPIEELNFLKNIHFHR